MFKRVQLSQENKAVIVALSERNVSFREIARQIGYNESSVRRFSNKYRQDHTLTRKIGTGLKRCTTVREDRELKRLSLRNRFETASELRADLQEATGAEVSVRTIQNRLNEMGLLARRPAKKPLLTSKMKKTRHSWAKERLNWSVQDWSNVVFSDESKFNLIGPDGKQTVRRRKGERYSEECIAHTVKHSPYVMVWGCITAIGVGSLIMLEGTVNAMQYKKIILDGVVPSMEMMTAKTPKPIFQDDSAPCHRAKSVSNSKFFFHIFGCFENLMILHFKFPPQIKTLKEELGIESLIWPGNSPDLNPIENVWALMGKKIQAKRPKTMQHLKSIIEEVWFNEIDDNYLGNLYASMPNRVQDVVRAKGGATKY